MNFDEITDDNFILYAARNYDNPQCCNITEFEEDLLRIKYIKRLFNKYLASDVLKERLIINHLIILNNVFGTTASTRLIFFKMEEYHYALLKTFLIYLNILPINDEIIKIETGLNMTDIPVMPDVVKLLRELE